MRGTNRPYPNVEGAHTVVAGAFVQMEDGTGIVHLAPAFGAEDLEVGRAQGWPVFKPVGDDGRFTELAPEFVRGLFVKDADPSIIEDLAARGRLLRAGTIEHTYPFCWRCATPLALLRAHLLVRAHDGGEGAPPGGERAGRLASRPHQARPLRELAREQRRLGALSRAVLGDAAADLAMCRGARDRDRFARRARHAGRTRPRRISIRTARRSTRSPSRARSAARSRDRVPEVIDAWYDSGAMPFAQWGYHPELGRGDEPFERRFPADFISEAIDQTRGWFYTLMAEGVLHFDSTAYRTVVCFGFIVDEQGRKMSKSLGNVVDPMAVMERHGRRRAPVGAVDERLPLVVTAARRHGAGRGGAPVPADALARLLVLRALRERRAGSTPMRSRHPPIAAAPPRSVDPLPARRHRP